MTQLPAVGHIIREQEIGLRLPNGVQVYPPELWHGHSLTNADEREIILGLIKAAALRLGFAEDHFLGNYAWVTREKIMAVVYEDGEEMPVTSTGVVVGFAGVDEGNLNGEVVTGETVPNASLVD